ncbi:tyrosine-type recombinase/integrase [Elstera cyanobacteriorum]|uniref:tyrosine-type recombinase/integrase n=1 Tax=Elstera cyanobacteriorum TaxID=2022747 RepID=UPI002354163D|nr:tyrosine-type recombinase/integrase [Elstera cyanobacteriorum]MCK6444103.1 tyrosine-type recombinase/integrase [Elstera cyanobacteriorum]
MPKPNSRNLPPYVKTQTRTYRHKATGEKVAKTYHYYRRPGAPNDGEPIPGDPNSPEFLATLAAYNARADGQPEKPHESTVAGLFAAFRLSPEFSRLRDKTRYDYDRILTRAEGFWGDLPHASITTKIAYALRDKLQKTPRQANLMLDVLRRVWQWGARRELVQDNPFARPERLPTKPRSDYWTPEDEAAFLAVAPPEMRLAFIMAVDTGQRRGDLLGMVWTAYDGEGFRLRQSKTGKAIRVPVTARLREALAATPRTSTHILTDPTGKPWSADTFGHLFTDLKRAIGREHLHFHDLRRTAVVRLSEAGCTILEIASVTGHTIQHSQRILDTYHVATEQQATAAVARLEAHNRKARTNRK